MAYALIGLEALLGLSGALLIIDGPLALSVVAMAAGLLLTFTAVSMRPGEIAQAWNAGHFVVPFLLLPAVFMAAQCIPLSPLANSIWVTAAAALNDRLSGFVTIDVGATALAICRYLALAAVAIVSMCVAINRRQAQSLFRVLIVVSVVLSLAMLVVLAVAPNLAAASGWDLRAVLTAVASLGILLSTTSVVRWFEQLEISRGKGAPGPVRSRSDVRVSNIALAGCVAVVATFGSRTAWLAVFCAWAPLVAVPAIRRFVSRTSAMRAAMAFVVVLAVGLLATRMLQGAGEAAIRIAATADASQIGVAQRMLGEIPWLGTGAGTYAALTEIYRTLADPPNVSIAPTAAAAFAAGLGHPALAVIVLLAIALAALLFDRSLRRGRDSFYPALGGGCLILMTFGMFADNALLSTTVAILAAATIGLALGQSLSTRQMLD